MTKWQSHVWLEKCFTTFSPKALLLLATSKYFWIQLLLLLSCHFFAFTYLICKTFFYVFQMPKFYSSCSVWTSWEFFVSHEDLGGLFISSSLSASLPHFPFFLFLFNPKHCFRRHHFFQNAKLVYTETQESTEHQLYIQLKKTFAIHWDRTWVLSVQKQSC